MFRKCLRSLGKYLWKKFVVNYIVSSFICLLQFFEIIILEDKRNWKNFIRFLEVANRNCKVQEFVQGFVKSQFVKSKLWYKRQEYSIKKIDLCACNVIRFLSDEFANFVFQSHHWSKWKSKFEEILIFKIIIAKIFGNGIKIKKRRISLSMIRRIPIPISL